ncbi:glycoside hydrolase family 3 protein [Pseudarthrobacter sp. J1738]|uniref:glycoside hydrolase family 3 protein n=1 Tax=unclassified Pseudarthrobacter TaxID=2647000 RepID=UPI003D2BAC74
MGKHRASLSIRRGITVLSAALSLGLLTACWSAAPPGSVNSAATSASEQPATSNTTATTRSTMTETPTPSVTTNKPAPGDAPLGWGPAKKDYDAAAAAISRMSLEEKAGQVLLPYYKGLDPSTELGLIKELHLAGTIIMGDNVPLLSDGSADVVAVKNLNTAFTEATMSDGRRWPGMIGVDQEGGAVARLRAPLTEWPSAMSLGASGNVQLARNMGQGIATELRYLGFNTDFAPDSDVTIGPADPVIGARSMSQNPTQAAELSTAVAEGILSGSVLPSIKHFPGHGSVTVDSHIALPVQDGTLAQLQARDLVPFQHGIDAGLPMVMTGHLDVKAVESGVPASVSPKNYQLLRSLGFNGVAITDALNMGALQKQYPGGSAAVAALAAGADLLLMPADVRLAHAAIVQSVADGTIPLFRLNEAATRVATMMIWRVRVASHGATPATAGSHMVLSRQISAAGLTVVQGQCVGNQIANGIQISGGTPQDRSRLADAATAAGIRVGTGPIVTLAGGTVRYAEGDFVIALDSPWVLAPSQAKLGKIALYGRSPGAFAALIQYLSGQASAPGKLPAAVGPYPVGTACK